ncbi:Transportin-3, partial [Toxocara canis]
LLNSPSENSQNGTPFEQQNNENGSDSWVRLSRDPVLWIDRIAAVFRQVQPWQKQVANPKNSQLKREAVEDAPVPWLDSVNIVWPVLSAVCTKYEKHVRIIEHCCRAVRFLIRSLGVQSIDFVEQLVPQVVILLHSGAFRSPPIFPFIHRLWVLVDELRHSKVAIEVKTIRNSRCFLQVI